MGHGLDGHIKHQTEAAETALDAWRSDMAARLRTEKVAQINLPSFTCVLMPHNCPGLLTDHTLFCKCFHNFGHHEDITVTYTGSS